MCSAPSVFSAQAEGPWDCVPHLTPHRAPKDSPQVGWKPTGALSAALSHTKWAPHQLVHPTATHGAAPLPPGLGTPAQRQG